MVEKISGIIPAAGKGKRFKGENKLLKNIGKFSIIIHTLKVFESCQEISEIVLVVPPKKISFYKRLISKYKIEKVKKIIKGGKERQDSVYNGIMNLEEDTKFVIIHDGDRVFVKKSLIKKIIKELKKHPAVVCGVPIKDTVKEVGKMGVIKTLEREKLWSIQTPQGFSYQLIKKAHQKAKKDKFHSTDDSALVEKLGYRVKVIPGFYSNIKITTYEDFIYGKFLYKNWDRL